MIRTAKIIKYDGSSLLLQPTEPISRELLLKQAELIEIRVTDGREISADQRKKIYAILRDISDWSGYTPDETKQVMKYSYIVATGEDEFSLSDTDMTTARGFISFLIEFCFVNSVPTKDTLLNLTDDTGKYLYMCLEHRKCAVCNKHAEVHHVNRIGMGRDREHIVHVGLKAIALCREHHNEAHAHERQLFGNYFVYGIKLNEHLCGCLNLNAK